MTIKELFAVAFKTLFAATIIDMSEPTMDSVEDYRVPLSMPFGRLLARFFGLPVSLSVAKPFFASLFRNMTGWHHPDSPRWQKILNWTVLKPLVFFSLNLIAMPFNFLLNVAKLALIFLPNVVFSLCSGAIAKLCVEMFDENTLLPVKILSGIGVGVLGLIGGALGVVVKISELLLSPLKTIKGLWSEDHKAASVMAGVILGAILAMSYMLLAPLVIYGLGPIVLAKAAALLPVAITNGINAVIAAIGALGAAIAPVCQVMGATFLGKLGAAIGLSTVQAGFGQLIGIALLSVGSALTVAKDRVGRWYHSLVQKTDYIDIQDNSLEDDYSDGHDNSPPSSLSYTIINKMIGEALPAPTPAASPVVVPASPPPSPVQADKSVSRESVKEEDGDLGLTNLFKGM